ncbi:permease [Echinimonas agarilytica]|uniref:Permease n=1 Tax=Echinimonas agarilytica TaxID=1215918 RepID=A0AA42B619_9GAMM|nr:permease [Echinimonas agarilytica]MCM2678292.1 permease [Echinimonas agarilytica]
MYLTLSILALLLGPLLYRLFERNTRLMGGLDAFIFVTIGGLVVFHMLPEILDNGGWLSLIFLAVGMSVPTMLEHLFRKIARQAHAGAMLFAAIGLGIHGMTDGAALAEAGSHGGHYLFALGVILHRLPVGLTIWWLLRPHFGVFIASLVLAAIAVSTVVGHTLAENWLSLLSGAPVAWFDALVVGTILHVVFHRPYHEDHAHEHNAEPHSHSHEDSHGEHAHQHQGSEQDWLQGIGSLIGVVVLLSIMMPYWLGVMEHGHHSAEMVAHQDTSVLVLERLLELSLVASPWLLLAYCVAAVIHYVVPRPFAGLSGGNTMGQALRGVVIGLPLPICVPNASKLYRMLVSEGAGRTYAIAFLMASPLLGIDAVLLTWGLLGGEWALWRIAVTLIFALSMALLVGHWLKNQEPEADEAAAPHVGSSVKRRLQQAIRHGYAHLIDHTAPWIVAGLVVASLIPVIDGFHLMPLLLGVVVLACICLPFHLCATGMTPVLAVLLINGLPPALALILLLIGPAINISLIKLIAQLHGVKTAYLMTILMLLLAFLFAFFMPVWPSVALELPHFQDASWVQYASLALLILLYSGSILRRGARAFVAELLPTGWPSHRH